MPDKTKGRLFGAKEADLSRGREKCEEIGNVDLFYIYCNGRASITRKQPNDAGNRYFNMME